MAEGDRNRIPTLPGRLAELRTAAGLSQQALARLAGTSLSAVSQLEGGTRSPSLELAGRLADALGVPVDALRQPAGDGPRALQRGRKKIPENLSE